jgi:hypothetical protein
MISPNDTSIPQFRIAGWLASVRKLIGALSAQMAP